VMVLSMGLVKGGGPLGRCPQSGLGGSGEGTLACHQVSPFIMPLQPRSALQVRLRSRLEAEQGIDISSSVESSCAVVYVAFIALILSYVHNTLLILSCLKRKTAASQ